MRMTPIRNTLLSVAAAAALFGAPAAGAQTAPAAQAPAATAPAAAALASKPLSKADQKIVTDMAAANMAEIEMAKLADSRSQNDQVKTYAKQMIDDHSKALADIQQLATARAVTLPTAIDKKHQAMADKLGALSGEAFDKAYMKQAGVDDHKKMHSMLGAAHKKAKDADVKALVTRIQPTVEQHLKAAQQMKPAKADAKKDKMPAATGAS